MVPFGRPAAIFDVDDSLLADAAAGSDYVKIRSGATFSRSAHPQILDSARTLR